MMTKLKHAFQNKVSLAVRKGFDLDVFAQVFSRVCKIATRRSIGPERDATAHSQVHGNAAQGYGVPSGQYSIDSTVSDAPFASSQGACGACQCPMLSTRKWEKFLAALPQFCSRSTESMKNFLLMKVCARRTWHGYNPVTNDPFSFCLLPNGKR
eukprot:6167739-Amphidinium_carterae.1